MSQKSDLLFADLTKSVVFLEGTLAQPHNDYMRAAAIQAFEIYFELSWKYLQARLTEGGLEANSPRAAFRVSGQVGLLDNVTDWLTFTEQRNLTVHTYQPQLADAVFAMIQTNFLPSIRSLLITAAPTTEF